MVECLQYVKVTQLSVEPMRVQPLSQPEDAPAERQYATYEYTQDDQEATLFTQEACHYFTRVYGYAFNDAWFQFRGNYDQPA